MRVLARWALLLIVGFPAVACGSGGVETVTTTATVTVTRHSAVNLVVTPTLHAELRATVDANSSPAEIRHTKGPLKGSIYYGRYGDLRYALAAFSLPRVGTTDQPLIFVQLPDDPHWLVVSDTGGDPAGSSVIPCPLRRVWGLGCHAA
jgi:hypothetical protein